MSHQNKKSLIGQVDDRPPAEDDTGRRWTFQTSR